MTDKEIRAWALLILSIKQLDKKDPKSIYESINSLELTKIINYIETGKNTPDS